MSMDIIVDNVELCKQTTYPVMEIFDSVQGEGAMMGMPVTFIRFFECNLTCEFCDTKLSWAKKEHNMSALDIMQQCNQNIVVITGGEPCLQQLEPLIALLHLNDKFICMETNGTLPTPTEVEIDWVTCSPKADTENHEEYGVPYYIHPGCFAQEYKFVVTEQFKYEDIPDDIRALAPGCVWLQPCSHQHESMQRAYNICMEHGMRLGLQAHKVWEVQ